MSREYQNEFLDHVSSCLHCQELEETIIDEQERFKQQDICYKDFKITDNYINERSGEL